MFHSHLYSQPCLIFVAFFNKVFIFFIWSHIVAEQGLHKVSGQCKHFFLELDAKRNHNEHSRILRYLDFFSEPYQQRSAVVYELDTNSLLFKPDFLCEVYAHFFLFLIFLIDYLWCRNFGAKSLRTIPVINTKSENKRVVFVLLQYEVIPHQEEAIWPSPIKVKKLLVLLGHFPRCHHEEGGFMGMRVRITCHPFELFIIWIFRWRRRN